MEDALRKLSSFDADLRFMGLSDLRSTLMMQPPDLREAVPLREAVVGRLADSITEVQNMAVRTLGTLVAAWASIGDMDEILAIVSDTARFKQQSGVRSLALKAIVDVCPVNLGLAIARQGVPDPLLLDNVDELDVLVAYLRRFGDHITAAEVAPLIDPLLVLVATKLKGLERLRGFEALRLGMPVALQSKTQWQRTLEFFLVQPDKPAGLQLLASLVDAVPRQFLEELWTRLEPESLQMLSSLENLADDEDEVAVVESEAVLMALNAVSAVGIGKSDVAVSVVTNFLMYDPGRTADYEGSFDDELGHDITDDDTGDASFRIRRMAARLAGTMSNSAPQLLSLVIDALGHEHEPDVRNELFEAAGKFDGLRFENILTLISRDISVSGLKLLAQLCSRAVEKNPPDVVPAADIAKLARTASQKRSLLRDALNLIAALEEWKSSNNASCLTSVSGDAWTDSAAVVNHALTTCATDDIQLQREALSVAENFQKVPFAPEALRIARRATDMSIRAQALECAAKLASPQLAPDVASHAVYLLRSEPASRILAATALTTLLPTLDDSSRNQAVATLGEVLGLSPLMPIASACYSALAAAAGFGCDSEILRAALAGPVDIAQTRVFVKVAATVGSDQALIDWLSVNWNADGAEDVASVVGKSSPLVAVDLQRVGASANIVAAAAAESEPLSVEIGQDIALVDALASRNRLTLGVEELAPMVATISDAEAGSVLGSVACLSPEEFSALQTIQVKPRALVLALEKVAERCPEWSDQLWSAAAALKEDVSGVVAPLVARSGEIERVRPDLRLDTAKIALPEATSLHIFLKLMKVVVDALQNPDYPQAPLTAAWAIQTLFSRYEGNSSELDELALQAASGIIASAKAFDPERVRSVQMGPFTLKVDDNAPLRQSALEAVFVIVSSRSDLVSPQMVEAAVDALGDSEHQIKILAYHVIAELATSELLEPYLSRIEASIENDMSRKVKDSVVKQEHDRQAALVRAAQEVRSKLFAS